MSFTEAYAAMALSSWPQRRRCSASSRHQWHDGTWSFWSRLWTSTSAWQVSITIASRSLESVNIVN